MEKLIKPGTHLKLLDTVCQARTQKRCGDLQRLLAAWPDEIADVSFPGRRRTVRRLEKALRQERSRGRAGHWAYDVARHQQLAHHLRAEQAALRKLENLERFGQTQKLAAQKKSPHVADL